MKKRTLMLHSDYDHTGICRYLEQEARRGWLLEDINFGWCFRSAPPQEVRYAVTYYKDGDPYDPPEGQKDYFDLCAAAGWELVAQRRTMQVFRTEDPHAVPIETEPEVQVENVHRAMKSYLLNRSFYLLIMTLSLLLRYWTYKDFLFTAEHGSVLWLNLLLYVGVVFYEAAELLTYWHWRIRARRAARIEERFLPSYGIRWLETAVFAALYGLTVYFAAADGGVLVWGITLLATALIGYNFISNAVKDRLAAQGREMTGRWGDRTVSVMVVVFAALLAVLFCTGYRQGEHPEEAIKKIQERAAWSTDLSSAPLTPGDLGGWADENFNMKDGHGSDNFVGFTSHTFRRAEGAAADAPETMTYTVWTGEQEKLSARQAQLKTELHYAGSAAGEELFRPWETVSAGESAYSDVLHIDCGDTHSYLYCGEAKLVEMKFSWELTEEQLMTALDALCGA